MRHERVSAELISSIAVYIGDGAPTLRVAGIVRSWRTFPDEWDDSHTVVRGWQMRLRAVKSELVYHALPFALHEIDLDALPAHERRARLITRTLHWARQMLASEANHLRYQLCFDELRGASVAPEESGELPAAVRQRLAELEEVKGRSKDRDALRDAILVHGCATLKEAAEYLAETRGWPKSRAYGVATRWREQHAKRFV